MADRRFDSFVVFAEMRTGSNFLEANLNAFDGIECLGELFNPSFIGHKGVEVWQDIAMADRDRDPLVLLDVVRQRADALAGFRFFHDHDPRVLAPVLDDPRCAKIILTRNPIDSYVSRKIAVATGQWVLRNVKHQRNATIRFDASEFHQHIDALQEFQLFLLNALQVRGQTAFYLAYEDVGDLDVINGLGAWLGAGTALDKLSSDLIKQNTGPIVDRVENPDVMEAALARLDRFDLTRTPNFEPRRGPAAPTITVTDDAPLMYLPVRGGPEAEVEAWLRSVAPSGRILTGLSQKELRQWQRRHAGHRAFTVLRHPVARAHHAFTENILTGRFADVCRLLKRAYQVDLPEPSSSLDTDAHRAAFLGFLAFLRDNLAGKTPARVDPAWASQAAIVQGFAQFRAPDQILREERLADRLTSLAEDCGIGPSNAALPESADTGLAQIYDAGIEEAARQAYGRDYQSFGFGNWQRR